MKNKKEITKHKKNRHPKKDSIELHGELLYKKDHDETDADEVYHDPKVPGKFAGDC